MFSHPLLFNKPYVQPLVGDFFFQFYRGGDFITTSDRSNQFVSVGRVPSFIEEIEERGLAYSDSLQHIYSLLPNSICQAYTGTDLFHYFFPDFFFLFLFLFASSVLTFLLPGVAVNTSHCLLVMSSSSVFANLPRILGWLSASAFLQAYLIFRPKFLLVLLFLYLESFFWRSSVGV